MIVGGLTGVFIGGRIEMSLTLKELRSVQGALMAAAKRTRSAAVKKQLQVAIDVCENAKSECECEYCYGSGCCSECGGSGECSECR